MHLAEFNLGILRHAWGSAKIADFENGLEHVNRIAERSPGFVWRLSDDDMDAMQNDPVGPFGANPRLASTLSVWEDLESLEHFVWNTVHKRFYDRRHEWFGDEQTIRLVLWRVAEGHRPSIAEAAKRLRHLEAHGDTDIAFGWRHAKSVYCVDQKPAE